MKDIFGDALLDYHNGNYSEDIITETSISEEDIMPLSYLFRTYSEMPLIEQKALDLAKGKILDIGCGAGSHSLYLQEKGKDVTAIDISKGAIEVSKARGVAKAFEKNIWEVQNEKFDTLLILMNGTGIFETVDKTIDCLRSLKLLLNEGGTILIDSCDLSYMYDQNEDGSIWVPADRYYGELDFKMSYKKETTESFPWLYLDKNLFQQIAIEAGLNYSLLVEDYQSQAFLVQLSL